MKKYQVPPESLEERRLRLARVRFSRLSKLQGKGSRILWALRGKP